MSENGHIIEGGLDALMGNCNYLPWSFSRADTAGACLYKFHKVYVNGEVETSPSLTLGSLSHEVIAKLLEERITDEDAAREILIDIYNNYRFEESAEETLVTAQGFMPYMCSFVKNWIDFIDKRNIKNYRVEHPYGVTSKFTRSFYRPRPLRETYFRGIIDLWAYDPESKELIIVDHKTNKSAVSKNKVHDHHQLNLYAQILSNIYKMPWERARVGLNFLRKEKIVWAVLSPEEVSYHTQVFKNTLVYLENELYQAENSMVWPKRESYKCSWCAFKETCQSEIEEYIF